MRRAKERGREADEDTFGSSDLAACAHPAAINAAYDRIAKERNLR